MKFVDGKPVWSANDNRRHTRTQRKSTETLREGRLRVGLLLCRAAVHFAMKLPEDEREAWFDKYESMTRCGK